MSKNGLIFVRHNRELIEEGCYLYATSHFPSYTLDLPAQTFTVTILRDPLARLVSYYRYLLWARTDEEAAREEPAMGAMRHELEWSAGSFQSFLEQTPRRHLLAQLAMFTRDYDVDEAYERILACSQVCFTETFGTDIARLRKRLQLPLEEKHERRFGEAVELTEEEQERARAVLEPEFVLLRKVRKELNRSQHPL